MEFLTDEPVEIGQIVIHPQFKTKHVILAKKSDAAEVKITTYGWRDVTLWDRRTASSKELAIIIDTQEGVIADYYKSAQKQQKEDIELRTQHNQLKRDFAQLEIQKGNIENKAKKQIADLEKQLGEFRNQALDTQTHQQELSIKTTENKELQAQCEDQRQTIIRLQSRLSEMMNPEARIAHQQTRIQFITLKDHVDDAPADVKIANLLSEGWQIVNQQLKPTWLYDEDGSARTVSHTMRYTAFTRLAPAETPGEDDEEAQVHLPESMDEAIKQALGKNDGSHIAQLTAPIIDVANTGFKPN